MAEQIEWFKRNVPVEPDALPPVLDVEWNFQSPTCPRRVPVPLAQAKMREFLHAMERHYGKKPIIYADIKFHREVLANGEFAEYPFWVRSVAAVPHVRYPGRRWAFWQITATAASPVSRRRWTAMSSPARITSGSNWPRPASATGITTMVRRRWPRRPRPRRRLRRP